MAVASTPGSATAWAEQALADFACDFPVDRIPPSAALTVRRILLAVAGTVIAGADEDGCAAVRQRLIARGGRPEATVLVSGERLPAPGAAMINAMMARALDYCDAMAPGPHCGAAVVASSLAAAEKVGGCSGRDFLAALAVGAEVAARMNRSEAGYDGFDPTGVSVVFGATAAAGRLLGLDGRRMRDALGLAFNRCGGSFQSNVDGSLAVRTIQGWVAEAGIDCAELAALGVTGPAHFIDGIYGYCHLFRADKTRRAGARSGDRGAADANTNGHTGSRAGALGVDGDTGDTGAAIVAGLGTEFRLERAMFKKYPSCGVTQGVTDLMLGIVAQRPIAADELQAAEVRLPPYAHRLVGQPFAPGANPRVDAQFSAAYCVANALVRRESRLEHFRPEAIADAAVRTVLPRVAVVADPALDARGHSAVDLVVTLTDGTRIVRGVDVAPGFPGRGLDAAEHRRRFDACLDYADRRSFDASRGQAIVTAIDGLDSISDIRDLIALLVDDSATLAVSASSRAGSGHVVP